MQLFIAHSLVFLQISIASLFFALCGFLLKCLVLKKKDANKFYENGLFGFVFIGFISLGLNFFFPLSLLLNNIVFLIIIILAFKLNYFKQNLLKLLKNIFIVTLIAYLFLIYSNVNRPDAFSYHLQYSQILNDHKIIVGLSNIHFRFGHISIFQYISSFFVNNVYSQNGLLIPISLVPSFFYIYCVKKFLKDFDNIKTRLNAYFVFLFFVISVYSFSRYSGWGNDAQVHIFYFLTIIYLLDLNNNKNNLELFYKLSLTSLFTFLIKPFYLLSFIIPFVFFIFYKEKINLIKSRTTFFILFFFFMWIIKNFLVSSCAVYPLLHTCNDKLSWFNKKDIVEQSLSAEAWSKDWINRENKSLNYEEYIEGFDWIKTWGDNHFKIVYEKITPVLVFLILNFLLFYFTNCLKKNYSQEKNTFFIFFLFLNILTLFIWFNKFPLYRFGVSYVNLFMISFFYFLFIKNINLNKVIKLKSLFILIIFLSFLGLFIKNSLRIYDTKNVSIYPSLINLDRVPKLQKIYDENNNFTHYHSMNGECGASKSPCTHFNVNITKNTIFGYKIFKIKK
tara:strand:- start:645 stop:2330 length:1686 start_codon:yes stop_codon:yes gene_type:complete